MQAAKCRGGLEDQSPVSSCQLDFGLPRRHVFQPCPWLLVEQAATCFVVKRQSDAVITRESQGHLHQITHTKHSRGKAEQSGAPFLLARWRAPVHRLEHYKTALRTRFLRQTDGRGGDGHALVACLLQGREALRLRANVETQRGRIFGEALQVEHGKVFFALSGRDPRSFALFFGEVKGGESFCMRTGLPGLALILRNTRVPGKGLHLGLTFQRRAHKTPELVAGHVAVGLKEGRHSMKHLHGSKQLPANQFGAILAAPPHFIFQAAITVLQQQRCHHCAYDQPRHERANGGSSGRGAEVRVLRHVLCNPPETAPIMPIGACEVTISACSCARLCKIPPDFCEATP